MENQIIILEEIKSAIWILIYVVGIGVIFNILRAVAESYKTIKDEINNAFYNTASAMFENGYHDELINYCHKQLKKKPKEVYGYWFLGKAHFEKKEYEDALVNFNKTLEIHPSWEKEWVSPYLKKIEAAKSTANKSLKPGTPQSGAP